MYAEVLYARFRTPACTVRPVLRCPAVALPAEDGRRRRPPAGPALTAVWWFTPIGRVPLLTQRLQEAGGGNVHQVYQLAEG
jgi:hypothetical protein